MNYNNLFKNGKSGQGIDSIVEQILEDLANGNRILNLDEMIALPQFQESRCMIFYYIGDKISDFLQALSGEIRNRRIYKENKFVYHRIANTNEYLALCLMKRRAGSDAEADDHFRQFLMNMELQKTNHKVYFGKPVWFAGDLQSSYWQAVICKRYGRILWNLNHVVFFRDVECLASVEKSNISIDEIIELNKAINSFDATETLEAFLENKSIKKAADAVFINENTMRYRVTKIQQVLKIDINSPIIALDLLIKSKLYKLLMGKPETDENVPG